MRAPGVIFCAGSRRSRLGCRLVECGDAWIAVAISHPGLVALGVPEDSLQSFPEAFRVGMAARAETLRDYGPNDPRNWDLPFGSGQIHVLLSAFSDTEEKWRRTIATARPDQGHSGVIVLDPGLRRPARQPQPVRLQGQHRSTRSRGAASCRFPARDGRSRRGSSFSAIPPRRECRWRCPAGRAGAQRHLVGLRKYQSRVGAFNRFLRDNAKSDDERELLAAKLAGRWRSGAPLALAPTRDDPALGQDPQRNNDFTYADDPDGKQVPLGCHMRRMNPRDTRMPVLSDVNRHRIIRRGTAYGAPYDPNVLAEQEDEVERGVYFLLISAKAMDTLEFLQREWINGGNFMGLGSERDPNVGLQEKGATFTIPEDPVRRRIHGIETFNVLRGGEYFFMPSLSALKWLADLKG